MDARLINTIENNDNHNIIINLFYSRTPLEIDEIQIKYEELYLGHNFDEDISNYLNRFHFR